MALGVSAAGFAPVTVAHWLDAFAALSDRPVTVERKLSDASTALPRGICHHIRRIWPEPAARYKIVVLRSNLCPTRSL